MNTYRTWIFGQRVTTEAVIESETSFAARQLVAQRHHVDVTDVIAQAVRYDQLAAWLNQR